jgi:lipid II:glycine glycyltransferase (peptidoglycan interpeptide bridge formation enzyme)
MKFRDIQATIIIDLTKPIEKLWENLDKKARWGVKKAKKGELKVRKIEKNDEDRWHIFYEIYKETCRNGGIIPLPLKKIKDSILFICEKDKKMIAGAAIEEEMEEKKIKLFLNASLHEFLELQPNNLLYWALIYWAKKEGYEFFDLGGYQLKALEGSKLYEVNRFKERWGGQIFRYYIYSSNPFYILGRKIIRNFPIAKKIRDKIRPVF